MKIGERTLVMGVLNVTPDSFSDGGRFFEFEQAVRRAEQMVSEGADVIDVGGESTRPGGSPVSSEEEIRRVSGIVQHLSARCTVPISIDTTKSLVARAALDCGAAIINDVSGLRFDPHLAEAAAAAGAGLVLMHSRGTASTLHTIPPVADIFEDIRKSLDVSISLAERHGVKRTSIVIDPGIGFGKTHAQNVELIARLDEVAAMFPGLPLLIGTSRKSFIGQILEGAGANERLLGTMATVTAAILNGAHIVRVHDVKEAVQTVRVADELKRASVRMKSGQ